MSLFPERRIAPMCIVSRAKDSIDDIGSGAEYSSDVIVSGTKDITMPLFPERRIAPM